MGSTAPGTVGYFKRHSLSFQPVVLGKTGFSISPVGFGGYRVEENSLAHKEALKLALLSGCNLIDTSTNYTNGSSERLIGQIIKELADLGKLSREEIVIVSKVGYVQGDNLELANARIAAGQPFPEMVKYLPECWHCISPEFLEDQITRSLNRLQIDQLDVLLLHNPEYFLKSVQNHAEYYRRISEAFKYLELEVKRGRIQYYGISSNTFPESKEAPDYTSLETVIELAADLGPNGHFAVIQFPFNLFEPGAVFESNNSGKSITELAVTNHIGTLINRPLNAFSGQRMIRLASYPFHLGDVQSLLKMALEKAFEHESRYPAQSFMPAKSVAWAHVIRSNLDRLQELDTWKQVLQYQILPELNAGLARLESQPEWVDWASEQRRLIQIVFIALTAYLETDVAHMSREISQALDLACPELQTSITLSNKVIRVYRSVPGVDCVLVGMRQPSYVLDSLALQPKLTTEQTSSALEVVQSAKH